MKGSDRHLVGPQSLWMSLNPAPTNILFFSSTFLFILFPCSFNLFPQLFLQNCQGYSQDEAGVVKKWTKERQNTLDIGVQWPGMASVGLP